MLFGQSQFGNMFQIIYDAYKREPEAAIQIGAALLHSDVEFEHHSYGPLDFYVLDEKRQGLDKSFCSLLFNRAIEDCFWNFEFLRYRDR